MKRHSGPWHHHGGQVNDHDAYPAWQAGEVEADGPTDWTETHKHEEQGDGEEESGEADVAS